jgi:hypothetical protein
MGESTLKLETSSRLASEKMHKRSRHAKKYLTSFRNRLVSGEQVSGRLRTFCNFQRGVY